MALRDSDPPEVGGYRIEDRLGSGGMGVVYLARSASGRRLAVKVVHGQYADDDEFRTRFRREVAAARQVSGAFTAPVVDADADAPRPWMATLYIPGEDLGTHVRRHGPLSPERLRALAAGLTEALRDIHRAGVVHRDLKPANVMLADDGPRVIDFGISRATESAAADALTQTGRVMGTPPFMSPEQFSSPHEVGSASDIFSLGAILVYAATRHGPFDSASPWETATKVVESEPELDGLPDDLLPFVSLCLEKHPKSRPTPDELLTLLREGRLPDPRPEPAEPDTEPVRPRGRRRKLWLAATAGALVLVAAASATALRLTGGEHGPPGDLPKGWYAWQTQESDKATTAGGSFTSCAALDGGLVCAGDGLKAVRFSLATGKIAWSLPEADHPDPSTSGSGYPDSGVIGTHGHDVYTVADSKARSAQDSHYVFQALDARTGKIRWNRPLGQEKPTAVEGTVAVTKDGPIVTYGQDGRTYSLLDPAHGTPRWKRTMPANDTCGLRTAAGNGYLVCVDGNSAHTTIVRIDPAHGTARWTATVDGALTLAGRTGGRLVLVTSPDSPVGPEETTIPPYRRITLLDLADRSPHVVPLDWPVPWAATPTLLGGTLYFVQDSGAVRAVAPATGHTLWDTASSVERPGTPVVSDAYVLLASPGGRLAALDRGNGKEVHSIPGRGTGLEPFTGYAGAPPVVHGDAVYVPYGTRSVYTVNLRAL
ncbi:PQQ-binding-like beta-propeller repeat protein [Streptomyces diastatochromogenes]|uniref:protein kinase domain-containing protein n=1 Tax=Streptomyces diastatochromogenes TaxID=42236 RepID=UPI00365EA3AA